MFHRNHIRRLRALAAALALLLPLVAGACQPKEPQDPPKDTLTPLTVILDYTINTNHSGLYVAKDKGYYEDEGLDVTIVEPSDGVTLQLVAAGRGEIGVSYQEDLTYARTGDDALPLRAIATVIQHNTSGFVADRAKGITRPRDFAGKTYAGWGSPSEAAVIRAVMTADGADPDTVRIISSSASNYANLAGDIDLMWFFEGWDLISARQQGMDLVYMPLRDLDPRLDYYTPILVARDDWLEDEPELAKAFLRATARGYDEASDADRAEAVTDILLKYAPDLDRPFILASQKFLAGAYRADAPRWGEMKAEVWENYAAFMQEWDLIDEVHDAAYYATNDYLPEGTK